MTAGPWAISVNQCSLIRILELHLLLLSLDAFALRSCIAAL